MVAYACNPEGHGEHWLGWGWAEKAAKLADVHLLTPTWARDAVERHAAAHGITAHFPEIAAPLLRATAPLGNNGLWIRQYFWQHQAAALARDLHARHRFDLVHQTTFHTFRVPFRSALLGIPAVWGPMAGGESAPPGFEPWLGSMRASEALRPILNGACLALPAVRRSLRAARQLLVANRTTLQFLPEWCRAKARIVPPNAIDENQLAAGPLPRASRGDRLELLFLGNMVGTRAIPLVLEAIARVPEIPLRLTIAGDGPAQTAWKRDAARLGLADRVCFPGRIARTDLLPLYARTDALVFPALRDAGGSSLLEAMSLAVPVVCLDWAGPGEMVREANGIKIPVTSPEGAIAGFADAFRRLFRDPEWAHALGLQAAEDVRREFTWEHKREVLREVYSSVLGRDL
jgi:glycosyltransferase involved in cell wall biosynthesis